MGSAASQTSCAGCFAGLSGGSRGSKWQPDVPRHQQKVHTIEEALALQRPAEGTFLPSPAKSLVSPRSCYSAEWASPVPDRTVNIDKGPAVAAEFDIIINEVASNQGTLACQLDTDQPRVPAARGGARQRSRFEAEQILSSPGSLPPPMAVDEREALIRSILPTATFQMLAKVPKDLLTAATADGQNLRRRLARGATIVFVGAGLPGKRFTFERAAALGMKVVVIEHPDSWAKNLVQEGVVAKFCPVDMSQSSDMVYEQARSLIQGLGQDSLTGPADGIATFVELSVPLVARLCEGLGLPGHRPAAVDAARNKHATRAALKVAGLPTPRNFLIKDKSQILEAGRLVGFPAVLKPASGAASLGVKKVTNAAELHDCFNEIIAELSTLVVTSGALVKGDANAGGVDASKVLDMSILLEQYLDGAEVDVDVVMSEGEYQYAAVADNGPTMEPYFNETWAVCPSLLPKDQQKELKELAIASCKAVGFSAGVFHVECKMTSTGPQLIEVNARMGGGQVAECNLRCWGVDLVEETLFAALGIPSRPPVPKMPLSAVAYCYVNAPISGRVHDFSKLEAIQTKPGVVWAKPLVRPGAEVIGTDRGLPTWLCDLFVTRPTARAALDFLQALEAENPVPVVVA